MSRVRSAALSGVLALSLLGLAACGSDSSDAESGGASLSSVTIEGEQGEEPKVTFDGRLDGSEDRDRGPHRGRRRGASPTATPSSANWWIGNGFTEEEAHEHLRRGRRPQSLSVDDEVLPFLREAMIGQPGRRPRRAC